MSDVPANEHEGHNACSAIFWSSTSLLTFLVDGSADYSACNPVNSLPMKYLNLSHDYKPHRMTVPQETHVQMLAIYTCHMTL